MNYKTIDFFIDNETYSPKDFLKAFKGIEKTQNVYLNYLGNDFTQYYADDNKGVEKIQKTNCPYCKTIRKAFINSEAYSEDLSRRILSARCVNCENSFHALQEACSEYQLN